MLHIILVREKKIFTLYGHGGHLGNLMLHTKFYDNRLPGSGKDF